MLIKDMNSQTKLSFRAVQRILSAPKASLIVAAVATSVLLAACGGGSDDTFNTASTVNAASRNATAFSVTSPTANATVAP